MEEHHFMTGPETPFVEKIGEMARAVKKQWMTEKNISLILLANVPEQRQKLRQADMLYKNIELSLRFNQARRAVWYFAAYDALCRQLFSEEALEKAQEKIAE